MKKAHPVLQLRLGYLADLAARIESPFCVAYRLPFPDFELRRDISEFPCAVYARLGTGLGRLAGIQLQRKPGGECQAQVTGTRCYSRVMRKIIRVLHPAATVLRLWLLLGLHSVETQSREHPCYGVPRVDVVFLDSIRYRGVYDPLMDFVTLNRQQLWI